MNFPKWVTSDIVISDLIHRGFNVHVDSEYGVVNIRLLEPWIFEVVPDEYREKFKSLCNDFEPIIYSILNVDELFARYQYSAIDGTIFSKIKYDIQSRLDEYEYTTGASIKDMLISHLKGEHCALLER